MEGGSTVTGLRTGLSLYLAHDISRTIYGGVEALVVDKIAYTYLPTALAVARAREEQIQREAGKDQ